MVSDNIGFPRIRFQDGEMIFLCSINLKVLCNKNAERGGIHSIYCIGKGKESPDLQRWKKKTTKERGKERAMQGQDRQTDREILCWTE